LAGAPGRDNALMPAGGSDKGVLFTLLLRANGTAQAVAYRTNAQVFDGVDSGAFPSSCEFDFASCKN
jgi:hypothetical protein